MTPRLNLNLALPPETREKMEYIKSTARISYTAQVEQAIDMLHDRLFPQEAAADGLVLGYLKVDRPGDLDADAPCGECGQELGVRGMWLRVTGDGGFTGPLCAGCASSE